MLSSQLLPTAVLAGDVNAYEYLNNIRKQADMVKFSHNKSLADAAQNHADYLHIHRLGGHGEQRGRRGFTGSNHVDRIVHMAYLSRLTSENVSYHSGYKSAKDSVDGLMSAIYHRFAFLSFKYDEIGIGQQQSNDYSTHVYNFGNQQLNRLCTLDSFNQRGKYFYSVCADDRFRIASHKLANAKHAVNKKSAAVVVWPAADSQDIPPAFYEEDPDPLPNHDVSGYPVSVQFNPAAFPDGLPVIERFEMFRHEDNQLVELIVRLDASSDRHRKFLPNEHAIFPLYRLDWQTRYRVEIDYQVPGQDLQRLEWIFTTQQTPLPMVTISEDGQTINAKEGESFAIYVPPRGRKDGRGEYTMRYTDNIKLDVKIHDNHTLLVNATGHPGEAFINFHGLNIRVVFYKG